MRVRLELIRHGLVQVVAQVPADAQPVGRQVQQLPLRADAFEEHHQLQLEEDHRVDGRAFLPGVLLADQLTGRS
jgi:hypothetical protein